MEIKTTKQIHYEYVREEEIDLSNKKWVSVESLIQNYQEKIDRIENNVDKKAIKEARAMRLLLNSLKRELGADEE